MERIYKFPHLWWLVGIGCPDLKTEVELSVSVESLIWVNNQLEAQQVIRVRKHCLTRLGQLQFIDILRVTTVGFEKNKNYLGSRLTQELCALGMIEE